MDSRSRVDVAADGDVSAVPGGTIVTGLAEYNAEQQAARRNRGLHERLPRDRHPWEALFENWESEFLQMAVFVLLTTFLIQKGSPESRRPGVKELVDADPRDFADDPDAPWPVQARRLDLAALRAFARPRVHPAVSDLVGGHALGGFAEYAADEVLHHQAAARVHRLPHLVPLLVRIVSELAERVPGDRVDGVARRLPSTTMVAGIETRACAACRNRTLRGRIDDAHDEQRAQRPTGRPRRRSRSLRSSPRTSWPTSSSWAPA